MERAGRHVDLKANSSQRANCVEFILVNKVKLDGKVVVKIPEPEVFREVVGRANGDLISENTDWCLTLEFAEPDDSGVGRIALNLQEGSGAARFRELIRSYSTSQVDYETYPITAILRKHALSAFLHSGHYVRNENLAAVIAKCNPGLKGKFTLVDIKEMKPRLDEKRAAATPLPRIITLDGDAEFLESLAQHTKNHRFRLSNKFFYLNGGVRRDSAKSSGEEIPALPASLITDFLKGHNDRIVEAARQQEAARARGHK
jgi:hypothetical protein